ncbi:MAG: 4Fe-4S dicluster domain-containing protein [Syntrophorhabdaceae bacterium]|nr:4Fe-4S dicluster domain-containing protein [Syntrophorhabdaceae bacterium]
MAVRANPNLLKQLKRYGADDVTKCFHCGTCSATCPLSQEPFLFPRKSMRYLQMGLGDRLKGNLEPWLCYYCGDCSDQCPREAQPGETMMSMRRWLTAKYDFTGLSMLFYESRTAEVAAIIVVGILSGIGFYLLGALSGGDFGSYPGFIPGHNAEYLTELGWDVKSVVLVMAVFVLGLLGINVLRMWWFTTGSRKDLNVPFDIYMKHILLCPWHFFTQKRYSECDKKKPWVVHIILMLGFVALFAVFLAHMIWQDDTHAHTYLGPLAGVMLVGASSFALSGRLNKTEAHYKYSHHSDMNFLYMCLFVGLTGLAQHIAGRIGCGAFANFMYILHMMGAVPMLLIQLPFTKWAHLVYRPHAMYFAAIQADVIAGREGAKGASAVPHKQSA